MLLPIHSSITSEVNGAGHQTGYISCEDWSCLTSFVQAGEQFIDTVAFWFPWLNCINGKAIAILS